MLNVCLLFLLHDCAICLPGKYELPILRCPYNLTMALSQLYSQNKITFDLAVDKYVMSHFLVWFMAFENTNQTGLQGHPSLLWADHLNGGLLRLRLSSTICICEWKRRMNDGMVPLNAPHTCIRISHSVDKKRTDDILKPELFVRKNHSNI